jgi:hypothetical protein
MSAMSILTIWQMRPKRVREIFRDLSRLASIFEVDRIVCRLNSQILGLQLVFSSMYYAQRPVTACRMDGRAMADRKW